MINKYPEGLLEFVKDNAAGKTTQEITDLVNNTFGPGTITQEKMRAYKKNHKIKSGLDCKFKKGRTPYNKGKKWDEYMSPEGQERSRQTTFSENNKPHNLRRVGDQSKTTDGYHITKIKSKGIQRERWQFTHRLIWEKANGPIPEGKLVEFADGDRDNLDINNLILVDRAEHLGLLKMIPEREDPEITKTALNVIKLQNTIKKAKEERKA